MLEQKRGFSPDINTLPVSQLTTDVMNVLQPPPRADVKEEIQRSLHERDGFMQIMKSYPSFERTVRNTRKLYYGATDIVTDAGEDRPKDFTDVKDPHAKNFLTALLIARTKHAQGTPIQEGEAIRSELKISDENSGDALKKLTFRQVLHATLAGELHLPETEIAENYENNPEPIRMPVIPHPRESQEDLPSQPEPQRILQQVRRRLKQLTRV